MAVCPACNSQVPDTAEVCPACHTNLTFTRVMPRLQGSWCKSCGALVPEGSEVCPKCGSPQASYSSLSHSARRQPQSVSSRIPSVDEAQSPEQTNVMPRIGSAIPAEPDPEAEVMYGKEHLPKTKTFMVAALASLLIVGGGIILITHPWDPTLTDTRATTAADVSTAGYPGEVNRLSGQDKTESAATTTISADEQTYSELSEAYTKLGELSATANELEQDLDEFGCSGTQDERSSASRDAEQLSLDISNLAGEIAGIETSTTGTYTTERENLATLASWLRNRIEALERSWQLSAASDNPGQDEDSILAPMEGNRTTDGSEAYVNLFSAHYEEWEPTEK